MDDVLLSPSGQRMMGRISPIYDQSYVCKWLMQAMGLEWDAARAYMDELPYQAFPETATWGIRYWEQKYGIAPNPSLSLAQRRINVIARRGVRQSLNPGRLGQILGTITGAAVRVTEFPSEYRFQVSIADGSFSDYPGLVAYLEEIKQSHLGYGITVDLLGIRNENYVDLRDLRMAMRISNNPGAVYLDGRRKLDGTWRLRSGARGLGFHGLLIGAGFFNDWGVAADGLRMDGSFRTGNATGAGLSIAFGAKNDGTLRQERLGIWGGFVERGALRGRITMDSMWRLNGEVRLNGARKLNAGIKEEAI